MSQENVDLVKALLPREDWDLVQSFNQRWPRVREFFEVHSHADLESGFVRGGDRTSYRGVDGFRKTWLDWLAPWEGYRTEFEKFIEHGADVLVLVNDFGRRGGMEFEVRLLGAAVWTVREGKLARAFFYADRGDAIREVGLSTAMLGHD